MRQVIRFEPNQPVTVALEYPDGINVQSQYNGPQVKFSLTLNEGVGVTGLPAIQFLANPSGTGIRCTGSPDRF